MQSAVLAVNGISSCTALEHFASERFREAAPQLLWQMHCTAWSFELLEMNKAAGAAEFLWFNDEFTGSKRYPAQSKNFLLPRWLCLSS